MSETTIEEVLAWEALDSRGRPTVGCRVRLAGGASGRAIVPSGASTGGHEAAELRDREERHGGYGVRRAVASANGELADAVRGLDALERPLVDATMEQVDGDPTLARLGANAVLAISLAVTLAAAEVERQPLWRALSGQASPLLPLPMVNIVSGGAHARGALDIQDILAVPLAAATFAEAMDVIARVRQGTADLLDERGGSSALVADEGGLAAALDDNEAALALVTDGIERAGLDPGRDVGLAIDIAANQLLRGSVYALAIEDATLSSAELAGRLADWCTRYPIVSLEDVLAEDDWAAWRDASGLLGDGRQLLGDDLFATNAERLERGIREQVANAVLVKVNQAGTVTRAERVVRRAQQAGYATVVSARSGDTEDAWLADLAVGWEAGQIKVGSTMRSERTAKWNRLLEIEAEAGSDARYAGTAALGSAARVRG